MIASNEAQETWDELTRSSPDLVSRLLTRGCDYIAVPLPSAVVGMTYREHLRMEPVARTARFSCVWDPHRFEARVFEEVSASNVAIYEYKPSRVA